MIEKTWLVNALSIGISFKEFWTMTPHDVLLILEGYQKKREMETEYNNTMMYIQGRYFVDAIACTIGNMFSKKGAKNLEYPKKPYDLSEARELTEEEKQAKADEVIQNLMRMKENFDRAHNKGGDN